MYQKIGLLGLLCLFSIQIHAQSSTEKTKKPLAKIFQKKSTKEKSAQKETASALRSSKATYRQAKKEHKSAAAQEQEAREQLDQIRAARKTDRMEAKANGEQKPLGGLFSSKDPEEKAALKTAKAEYRSANKQRKVTSAQKQLAQERTDVLKAERKVLLKHKKAKKAEEKVERVKKN